MKAGTYKKESFSISTKLVSRRKIPKEKTASCSKYGVGSSQKKDAQFRRAPHIITIPTFGFVHDENTLPSNDCEHRGHRGSALPGAACHMYWGTGRETETMRGRVL